MSQPLANGEIQHDGDTQEEQPLDRNHDAANCLDIPPTSTAEPGSLQRLLQKEGPNARNVVSWLVPNLVGVGHGGSCGGGLAVDARNGDATGGLRSDRSRETSRERDHGRCVPGNKTPQVTRCLVCQQTKIPTCTSTQSHSVVTNVFASRIWTSHQRSVS